MKGRTEINYQTENIKSKYFIIPAVFGFIGLIIHSYIEIIGNIILIGAILYGLIFYIKTYNKEENMSYYKVEVNKLKISKEEYEATK